MKRKYFLLALLLLSFSALSCSMIHESVRTVWGSSVRVLQNERDNAISKSYYCSMDECFQAVVDLAESADEMGKTPYEIFMKDRLRRFIVVIKVPVSVDTTEVGIFFDRLGKEEIKIELSSLSTNAKLNAAGLIFERLDDLFTPSSEQMNIRIK